MALSKARLVPKVASIPSATTRSVRALYLQVALTHEQQRIGRMARPARFGNQNVQAQGCQVIRKGIGLHIPRQIDHLRVGVAVIAGLGLDDAGVAFDPFKGNGA